MKALRCISLLILLSIGHTCAYAQFGMTTFQVDGPTEVANYGGVGIGTAKARRHCADRICITFGAGRQILKKDNTFLATIPTESSPVIDPTKVVEVFQNQFLYADMKRYGRDRFQMIIEKKTDNELTLTAPGIIHYEMLNGQPVYTNDGGFAGIITAFRGSNENEIKEIIVSTPKRLDSFLGQSVKYEGKKYTLGSLGQKWKEEGTLAASALVPKIGQ